jgi:pantoate--beta-alanine ligase
LVKNFIESKYNTKIIACKTIRNKNKLALSSRNFLLNKSDLKIVENISKQFQKLKKEAKKYKNINKFLNKSKRKFEKIFNIKIEYLENRNLKNLKNSSNYLGSKIFLSYYFKGIRLIDNF